MKAIIVEDNARFRKYLANVIRDLTELKLIGYAQNGREALDLIQKMEEKPDLILTDLNMPEMDGFALTSKIQEKYPKIKIVIISEHTAPDIVHKLFSKGILGYLAKIEVEDQIESCLFAVTRQRRYLGDEILVQLLFGEQKRKKNTSLTVSEKRLLSLILSKVNLEELSKVLNVEPEITNNQLRHLRVKLLK